MILVDTNVLFHAFMQRSADHEPCRQWLNSLRSSGEAWCITWPIAYEFLRITTHRGMLEQPLRAAEAWSILTMLLKPRATSVLVATGKHTEIAAATFVELPHASGNLMHDVHTLILMREHDVRRIATRDKAFRRFRGIEAVDPVLTN